MSEYALSRTRSAAIIRSSSVDARPTVLMTRTYSVPDISSYVRAADRYKPAWPYYYSYRSSWLAPYRYYRDYTLGDDYWYDRYYTFSPLYYRSMFPRRYYYSDYIANPYYWSSPTSYWTRYKGYLYDYSTPYYYRSYSSPYYGYHYGYGSYLSTLYSPYRSWLYNYTY
jgi:hypothetical protein